MFAVAKGVRGDDKEQIIVRQSRLCPLTELGLRKANHKESVERAQRRLQQCQEP